MTAWPIGPRVTALTSASRYRLAVQPQYAAILLPRSEGVDGGRDRKRNTELGVSKMPANQAQRYAPQIGLIGGPRAGKTTLIAALQIAATLHSRGAWTLTADEHSSPGSIAFLKQARRNLLFDYTFPRPTTAEEEPLAFVFSGTAEGSLLDRIAWELGFQGQPGSISVPLRVRDLPGESLDKDDPADGLWEALASCDAFVFLYDPTISKKNFYYLSSACEFIRMALRERQPLADERLPQYIAVCLSKFDNPDVFFTFAENGLVHYAPDDSSRMPCVRDEDARTAIALFNDALTVPFLEATFRPGQVRYFVTSAVGFLHSPEGYTRANADFSNDAGDKTIRSDAVPMNVFEPFCWLTNAMNRAR
jgi:hypothetical protein